MFMRLLCCIVFATGVLCGAAVTVEGQSQIPLKPGLWESSITSNVSGITLSPEMQARIAQMPPDAQARIRAAMGGDTPRTTMTRSCLTQHEFDEWNDSFSKGKNGDQTCTHSNVSGGMDRRSFDIACTSGSGKSTGHIEMIFDSDERAHGTIHLVSTTTEGAQAMHPITMDMKINTHYVGADCGSIKPGQAELVK
jgi:hypothetical protein